MSLLGTATILKLAVGLVKITFILHFNIMANADVIIILIQKQNMKKLMTVDVDRIERVVVGQMQFLHKRKLYSLLGTHWLGMVGVGILLAADWEPILMIV